MGVLIALAFAAAVLLVLFAVASGCTARCLDATSAIGTNVRSAVPEIIVFPNQQQEFFTQKEAAVYLRCSCWAVRAACYTGDLPCAKLGKSFIIHIADLRAWHDREKKKKASESGQPTAVGKSRSGRKKPNDSTRPSAMPGL
jgi:hypothetical protein